MGRIEMQEDRVLLDDWHPVAAVGDVPAGELVAARLLGGEIVLWRAGDGRVRAWEGRCPHRGTRLSIGRIYGGGEVWAISGWPFAGTARPPPGPAFAGV